jgi:hypothetical protein
MIMPSPMAFVVGTGLALALSAVLRKLTEDAYELARSRTRPSLLGDPAGSSSKQAA